MKEEVKRILKMIEDGKIDSDKAMELIEVINGGGEPQENLLTAISQDKMLRIKVLSGEEDTVNVNVPVKFLKSIGSAVNSIKIPGVSDQEGVDIKMIMEAIDSGLEGKIVDVKTAKGEFVEISID